jgi:hypothetical protein
VEKPQCLVTHTHKKVLFTPEMFFSLRHRDGVAVSVQPVGELESEDAVVMQMGGGWRSRSKFMQTRFS